MVNECVSPWSGGPTFSSILVPAAECQVRERSSEYDVCLGTIIGDSWNVDVCCSYTRVVIKIA